MSRARRKVRCGHPHRRRLSRRRLLAHCHAAKSTPLRRLRSTPIYRLLPQAVRRYTGAIAHSSALDLHDNCCTQLCAPSGRSGVARARLPGHSVVAVRRAPVRSERVLRQVRAGTLDESRLLPSAEKRSRDVAKKLDRLVSRQGWYPFMAGQAYAVATVKAPAKRNAEVMRWSKSAAGGRRCRGSRPTGWRSSTS